MAPESQEGSELVPDAWLRSQEERGAATDDWQKKVLLALGRVEGRIGTIEVKLESVISENTRQTREIGELKDHQHGRTRKLEHTVFGNEDCAQIGLAEKVRFLEHGWSKLTSIAVLAITLLIELAKFIGHWAWSTVANDHGIKLAKLIKP